MKIKQLLIVFCAFCGLTLISCNVEIPTYTVQVSGTVVDTQGVPVAGASIKIVDRCKDPNAMFGNVTNAYIDRVIGTTTTDENGHYALSVLTEGFHFDVSAVRKEYDWNSSISQSGSVRCECSSDKSDYILDMVVKTQIEHYTGNAWIDAVEATPLEINLSDSIHIRLKDGGTILSTGIWFDSPYETQEEGVVVMHHSYKSGYNLYYHVDGGDYSMPSGLTEYDFIFTIDTTSSTTYTISERCFLKVESLKNSKDEVSYFIPLIISGK